jgi:hypothetical protein
MNILHRCMFSFLLGIYLALELQDHVVTNILKKVKVNMVGVLSVQYEYKTFKPVEITIRRELR